MIIYAIYFAYFGLFLVFPLLFLIKTISLAQCNVLYMARKLMIWGLIQCVEYSISIISHRLRIAMTQWNNFNSYTWTLVYFNEPFFQLFSKSTNLPQGSALSTVPSCISSVSFRPLSANQGRNWNLSRNWNSSVSQQILSDLNLHLHLQSCSYNWRNSGQTGLNYSADSVTA